MSMTMIKNAAITAATVMAVVYALGMTAAGKDLVRKIFAPV